MESPLKITRCAFVVCKVQKCGEPYILVIRDPVWGDLTLVGGHEESDDDQDLERTARREMREELGGLTSTFRLVSLTDEIQYGPTWSKSAKQMRTYVFKYYGMEVDGNAEVHLGKTDKGFALELIKENALASQESLSNVVRIFLNLSKGDLTGVPVSWKIEECGCGSDGIKASFGGLSRESR